MKIRLHDFHLTAAMVGLLCGAGCSSPAGIDTRGTGGKSAGTGGSSSGTGGVTAGSGGATSGSGGATSGSGTGGSGTGGTVSVDAGTDGAVDGNVSADSPVSNWDGWRYANPCVVEDNPNTCNPVDICWHDSSRGRFSEKEMLPIGGEKGKLYEVTLRIRGVTEPRDYPTTCQKLPNGAATTTAVYTGCDGFANSSSVTFNIYELKIPEPAQSFYLNGVPVHPGHRVDKIDQTFTVKVTGQTVATFTYDDLNGGEIRNCSAIIPDIVNGPNNTPYDGNFFQLNVVSWKAL